MGTAALRFCSHYGCRALVPGGGRCAQHPRLDERPSAAARGYTRRWAEYSRAWLRRFPWCGQRQDGQLHAEHSRCVQRGERVPAEVTDHIVSARQGGAFWLPGNHQSLCTACNVRKG